MPTRSATGCGARSPAPRRCSRMSGSSRTRPPTSSTPSGRSSIATGASSMQSAADWLAGLSPWPTDGFGTDRIRELLDRLDNPQRSGWHERLQTDPAGFEAAIARVRADAEAVSATQFETLPAAAFLDYKERGIESAAIEAGLGGRHDATNVIDARVVLLTNVGLEHTEVLGSTRQAIAAEKLAVAPPGATVVLPDDEFAGLVPGA